MRLSRPRPSRLYLVASLAAALLAALALFAYLRGLGAQGAAGGRLVELVVAARDLREGEVLGPASLKLVPFPERYLFPGAFSDVAEVSGRTLRHPLSEGEPLLAGAVLPNREGGWAGSSIGAGFRAFPIPCASLSFPASQLAAGSRVDVVSCGEDLSRLILEDVRVIGLFSAAPSTTEEVSQGGGAWLEECCILLEVTPEEACVLATALQAGKVELALRPQREP